VRLDICLAGPVLYDVATVWREGDASGRGAAGRGRRSHGVEVVMAWSMLRRARFKSNQLLGQGLVPAIARIEEGKAISVAHRLSNMRTQLVANSRFEKEGWGEEELRRLINDYIEERARADNGTNTAVYTTSFWTKRTATCSCLGSGLSHPSRRASSQVGQGSGRYDPCGRRLDL